MWEATRLSLQVLAVSVPAILLLGIGLALVFSRTAFRGQSVVETVIMLPLVLPPSVVGYGLLRVLGRGGPLQEWFGVNVLFTWKAAAVASTIVGLPLMIQAARVGISGIDRSIEEAARVDGATKLRVLFTMTFPLARRGLAVGVALGSARALGEFGATLAVAGSIPGRTQTMPLAVYDAMQRGDYETANWISLAMIVLGYAAIWLTRRLAAPADDH
jgi:molybdate transport system permease protein